MAQCVTRNGEGLGPRLVLVQKSVPEWLNVFIIIACQSGSMYQCIMY